MFVYFLCSCVCFGISVVVVMGGGGQLGFVFVLLLLFLFVFVFWVGFFGGVIDAAAVFFIYFALCLRQVCTLFPENVRFHFHLF